MNKFWKLLIFNSAMVCASILLYADRFAGLSPGADEAYKVILFFVAFPIMLAIFLRVNTAIVSGTKKQKKISLLKNEELEEPKDYIKALQSLMYKKEFEKPIKVMCDQVKRMEPKVQSLEIILAQHFDKGEMTYVKFKTTLDDVQKLFYDNTKMAIKRMGVFDEEEYRLLMNNRLNITEDSRQQKIKIYHEHIEFVGSIVRRNEYIITLVDNLTLEISRLEDFNAQSAENVHILNDMKKLIENTKYYAN
mgnify:CR=1 FL=1